MANKKFTSISNDYSIIFDKNSEIIEVGDDIKIQEQGYCFVRIGDINKLDQLRTIDIIGVITAVGELSQVVLKTTGAHKDRRNITIVDESKMQIQISLWGSNASRKGYEINQVLAIRGARVSDYGGKTLNSGDEHSQIHFDFDHKRVDELKAWMETEDFTNQNFGSLTSFLQT